MDDLSVLGPPVSSGSPQVGTGEGQSRWAKAMPLLRIAILDVVGPIVAYSLFRSNGWSPVWALVMSGTLPASAVMARFVRRRSVDLIGVFIAVGVIASAAVAWISGDPRLVLAQDSVLTGVFGLVCLASLRSTQPPMFRLAVEFMGEDSPRGRDFADRLHHPAFRRSFHVMTAVWGVAYLAEAAARVMIVEAISTNVALGLSKSMPYVVATVLTAWAVAYGNRAKARGERFAAAQAVTDATGAEASSVS